MSSRLSVVEHKMGEARAKPTKSPAKRKEQYKGFAGAAVGAMFIGADFATLLLGWSATDEWLGGKASVKAGAMLFLFTYAPFRIGRERARTTPRKAKKPKVKKRRREKRFYDRRVCTGFGSRKAIRDKLEIGLGENAPATLTTLDWGLCDFSPDGLGLATGFDPPADHSTLWIKYDDQLYQGVVAWVKVYKEGEYRFGIHFLTTLPFPWP